MKVLKVSIAAFLVLGVTAAAEASTIVIFSTTGVFTSSGTDIYTGAGVTLDFDGVTDVGALLGAPQPNSSQLSFGTISSAGTGAPSPVGVADTFTLNIFQTLPSVGSSSYVGSLTGTLSFFNSTAYIQFDQPLTRLIGGVEYEIIEADNGTAGRVAVVHPLGGAESNIQGQITLVPESGSTLSLIGLGLLGVAFAGRRFV